MKKFKCNEMSKLYIYEYLCVCVVLISKKKYLIYSGLW